MPEIPDFEKIARDVLASALVVIEAHGEEYPSARPVVIDVPRQVAEQLRLVWNARGAADIVQLEALDVLKNGDAYVNILSRAIRSLDQ